MDLRKIRPLIRLRDIRSAVISFIVLFGGIALAGITFYAHEIEDARLAGIAAGASLVFVLLILIFVVPPLARNASKEASQLNLPFEFTGGGAVFLGLVAIVAFSAWNTGNNLLFLVLSVLTGAIVVGFFAGSSCLKKLDVRMRFPEVIFAGEETRIMVSIQNRKRIIPSFSVVAEVRGRERERSPSGDELAEILPRRLADRFSRPPIVRRTLHYFDYIPARQTVEKTSTHIFANRGRFLIKDFELSTRFPFGFFRHRRRLPARETELVVFPLIVPIDNALLDLPLEVGKLVSSKRGSGQDLLSLREYQPNDDLRRIDWKATARTRSLTVKEFASEDDTKIIIQLDSRVARPAGDGMSLRQRIEAEHKGGAVISERFERGASLAASLISHFIEQQAEICLIVDGSAGEFGLGNRHLYACLKRLAVAEPDFARNSEARLVFDLLTNNIAKFENLHAFIVTAAATDSISSGLTERCSILRY
ncbi:MAG: DUF58 domain-containing protein [Pyrinomonadaceae bacterium]